MHIVQTLCTGPKDFSVTTDSTKNTLQD